MSLLCILLTFVLASSETFPTEYQITAEINSKITISWAVQRETQTLAVSLVYRGIGWAGIGWNRLQHSMKNADMFVAEIQGEGGVVVSDYWSAHSDEEPLLDTVLGGNNSVIAQRGAIVDGVMLVEFIRPLASQDPDYDIEIKEGEVLTLLLAWGNEPKLVEHTDHPVHVQVDIFAGKILAPDHHQLKIIHGLFQSLAWGILFPLGGLVGRYKPQITPSIDWFTLHKILQGAGVTCTLLGFIIAFFMNFSHFDTVWHAQLGTTLIGLVLIQVIWALLRPQSDLLKSRGRVIWEKSHLAFGIVLPIVSMVTMYSGVYHLTYSRNLAVIPLVWYGLLMAAILFLEFRTRKRVSDTKVMLEATSVHSDDSD